MKTVTDKIRERLRKDRPMTTISMRIPEDVIEELKELAPLRGFAGYQTLMRTYISQGIQRDAEALERPEIRALQASLRGNGVAEEAIAQAVAEVFRKTA